MGMWGYLMRKLCGLPTHDSLKLIEAKNYKPTVTPCSECPPSCMCLYCDVKDRIVHERNLSPDSSTAEH